jgi:hypothetical protein
MLGIHEFPIIIAFFPPSKIEKSKKKSYLKKGGFSVKKKISETPF